MADGEWSATGREREVNIEIPNSKQLPLPPLSIVQGRFANWRDAILSTRVPDLRGRTVEEVKHKAGRVRLGEIFSSFNAFDRCLDS